MVDQTTRTNNDRSPAKQARTLFADALAEQRVAHREPRRSWPVLPAVTVETSDLVAEPGPLIEYARQLVQWQVEPPIDPRERSAWVPIDPPAPVDSSVTPAIRSLKLKGIGVGTATGPRQPSGDPYEDSLGHAHVGFDDAGEFALLYSDKAPFGGIFFDRARMEFRNAERLVRAGCPSTVPVALFRYENLNSGWQPTRALGVPVCGGPTETPLRAAGLFIADPDDDNIYGQACAALLELWGPDRMTALGQMAAECGRTLRQFHEAGLFRYGSSPTNYLLDPSTRRMCMVDLDSSPLLEECTPVRRSLELLRDVAGGIFNMGMVILIPSVAERFPPDALAGADHFLRFAEGYFSGSGVPAGVIEPFVDHFFARFREVYARREEIANSPTGDEILKGLWLDRSFCYATLVAGLAETYHRSPVARQHPLEVSPAEIAARAARFLETKPRTEW